jgi:excisionase family DNA binding protein
LTLSKGFRASGLLSTGDVARELGVHRSTVWIWIRDGLLKSKRVGTTVGVRRADLDAFKNMYRVNGEKTV